MLAVAAAPMDIMAARRPPILLVMVLSILALGAIALWDEQREAAAALDDFAAEQQSLAREAAASLVERVRNSNEPIAAPSTAAIEQPGSIVVLFQRPGDLALVTSGNVEIHDDTLTAAMSRAAPWQRLSRAEAASFGLPPRMAIAGFATADAGTHGIFKVAVIATAIRVRDRERRAIWRLVLGFGFTSALIVGFGLLAERKQKTELALAKSLALSEAMQSRDERLVRADKLATLGALATGIAHEVSTPLGVIVGRAEQLVPFAASDERATRSVKAITEQAERITRIIRAFLRLARGGTPTLEKVAPAELAAEALELVEHRFEKAGVTLARNIAAEGPRVACDPKLFEQVLVNLLLNACDACSEGGHVELAIRTHDDRVAFVVTDDGEGITPETARRATEPFFTTKSEDAGTGLGLAIANEIVKHHHGELTLAPRSDGAGTCATVELAAVQEDEHG